MEGKLQNLQKSLEDSKGLPVTFILVQDGSDEASAKELRNFGHGFNVTFIQVELNSPGLSRNAGLALAKTPWVAFWDSDDVGNAKNILSAIQRIETHHNVIIGSYETVSLTDGREVTTSTPKQLKQVMINPGIWRFAFRVKRLRNIEFPGMRMGEDQVFLAAIGLREEEIFFSDRNFYTYFVGGLEQLTRQPQYVAEVREAYEEVKKLLMKNDYPEPYVYVCLVRLMFTAAARRQVSFIDFLKFIGWDKNLTVLRRLQVIRAILFVLANRTKKTS
jgi:glycosyltransferase involved in cell wall biosynthesis